jgi:hypothetical protein
MVEERWVEFQMALSDNRRRYPTQEFEKFDYIEQCRDDPLVHRKVVQVVNGLTNSLKVERQPAPNEVLAEADRLECLKFAGYDPHFEGHEPPGLSRGTNPGSRESRHTGHNGKPKKLDGIQFAQVCGCG